MPLRAPHLRQRLPFIVLTVLAFALRSHALGDVPLRWDEGWSIALAALGPGEMVRLTALDVHPPLYYLLLKPWLALAGTTELLARWPSAAAATLAVPLAAVAGAALWRSSAIATEASPQPIAATGQRSDRGGDRRLARRRTALLTAGYVTLAPALVYYAGMTRMYALTTPLLLLAVWGLARWAADRPSKGVRSHVGAGALIAALIGTIGALYAFYYTAFALAGLLLALWLARPRRWGRPALVAVAATAAFAPWLLYAADALRSRVAARTGGVVDVLAVPRLVIEGAYATVFAYDAGWLAVAVIVGLLAVGHALAGARERWWWAVIWLPVGLTLVGAAVGAQAHMFAARYTIVAVPFVALGVGRALAALWARRPALGGLGVVAVVLAVLPTLSGYAYARAAEVTGDYDPAADWRALSERASEDDLVAFNVLSLAGAYERFRAPSDPAWTYAQVWDPVREPPQRAIARVLGALADHPRLWLVLYKGTYSPGSAAVKERLDQDLYPGQGWWRDDTLYQGYINAVPDTGVTPGARLEHGVTLVDASYTGTVEPGDGVAVNLRWRAETQPDTDGRVFVHAYDPDGQLIAQRDSFPAYGTLPPSTWQAGQEVRDRHGLWIPPDATGPLELVVGLYDPETGQRWRVAEVNDDATGTAADAGPAAGATVDDKESDTADDADRAAATASRPSGAGPSDHIRLGTIEVQR